ncbi:cGMP-dependent 3',5'-cyclic phosphodiesterase-like isoform X2 [Phlebotomus argentipes]|uniref:cGMP-dependent 3',5'-cyclic phosphodiesterase-like isoform X2 n=1 Tax=Phlebotomus argentipes TaxID=94469 RepID=UPI0028932854|nr:cGMP-dependent 3',5'-cyclic phosphodiesterase-like isoform X2 [Phlebotomus argentipes]
MSVGEEIGSKMNHLTLIEELSIAGTDSIQLQCVVNRYDVTGAPVAFLVPLIPTSDEGLLQVVGGKVLDKEIRFSVTSDDVNKVTKNGFSFLVNEKHNEFLEMIEKTIGKEQNILLFDIKHPQKSPGSGNHHVALFVSLVIEDKSTTVKREDYEKIIQEVFRYTLGHLLTAFELFEEKRVRDQCQNLLRVARRLLGKIGDLGKLMRGVMAEAKDLANAERCSLFLIDKYTGELVSKVFDGNEATEELRIENGQGIAGHVANTGKLLNIRNAYQHPLFYKGVDELTGFKTRSILCFPICDEENIIGVAQLCNKANGFHFDKCDEEIATAFSIYCGISIMHALVHERVQKAEARHKLSQELLLHHMKVPEDDVQSILLDMQNFGNKIDACAFSSFDYCPRDIERISSVYMSFQMFSDLGLVQKFKIPKDKLLRFLLLVQKGYRDMPYHNWTHAFSVTHFGFCLLKNLQLIERGMVTDLQALAFLVACLCHDLDHRGTNNSYQKHSRSSLAKLYSSEGSVNERHHLSQAICILNDANCKILDSLDNHQFKECIDVIGELILATDLAQHFRIISNLRQLTMENLKLKPMLFLSLLMTCCDLSDQVKPWPTTQFVAELVYAEFFAQGDLEKEMGLSPKEMMDRQKACIPELQIEFITTVVRPTFEILAHIFPEITPCLDTIDDNRRNWVMLREQQPYYNCITP